MRVARIVLTFLFFAGGSVALAQIPPRSDTTSTPIPGAGHDYIGASGETVNPADGSISIRIPVIMPPARGITLPFAFAYDSNGISYLGNNPSTDAIAWLPANSVVSLTGWSDTAPIVSATETTYT